MLHYIFKMISFWNDIIKSFYKHYVQIHNVTILYDK